jgi:hypothetical protein
MSGGHFPEKLPSASEGLPYTLGDEDSGLPTSVGDMARTASLFDIVNGFFNRCRGDMVRFLAFAARQALEDERCCTHKIIWLSENYRSIDNDPSGLLLVVWTLKREVRASGECLGMYRR